MLEQKLKDGNLYLKVDHIKDYTSLMTFVTTVAAKHGINIGSVSSQPGTNRGINITIFPTETKSTGIGTNIANANKEKYYD